MSSDEVTVNLARTRLASNVCCSLFWVLLLGIYLAVHKDEFSEWSKKYSQAATVYIVLTSLWGASCILSLIGSLIPNLRALQLLACIILCLIPISVLVFASIGVHLALDPNYFEKDHNGSRGRWGDWFNGISWFFVAVWITIGVCVMCCCSFLCCSLAAGTVQLDEIKEKVTVNVFGPNEEEEEPEPPAKCASE